MFLLLKDLPDSDVTHFLAHGPAFRKVSAVRGEPQSWCLYQVPMRQCCKGAILTRKLHRGAWNNGKEKNREAGLSSDGHGAKSTKPSHRVIWGLSLLALALYFPRPRMIICRGCSATVQRSASTLATHYSNLAEHPRARTSTL